MINVENWVTTCIHSPDKNGRCPDQPRLRFMALSLGNAKQNEERRVRNETLGPGVWSVFEAVRIQSVVQMAKEIMYNIPQHLRHQVHVSLAGNYANRMALLSGYAHDAEVVRAIHEAFPPSIINVSISVQTPEAMFAVVTASDIAMVRLKNVVDRNEDAHSDRVNSCVIVPHVKEGTVMVDVPGISGYALKPTAYSVSRNSSSSSFMLTRLRRSVRNGKERFQLPLVDITAFFGPQDVATAPARLPFGRMHIPIGFDLLRHFNNLALDPEVQESPSKSAHCSRVLRLLNTIFPDIPGRGQEETGQVAEAPAPAGEEEAFAVRMEDVGASQEEIAIVEAELSPAAVGPGAACTEAIAVVA